MIKSMTGFGRGEASDSSRKIIVEMKAVNHRYADVSVKMPKKLAAFEIKLRNILKEYASRGKIDIFVTYEEQGDLDQEVSYNQPLAAGYMKAMETISADFEIVNDVKVSYLARCPEVLTLVEREVDQDSTWELLEKAFRQAAEMFVEARSNEGQRLYDDLNGKLDHMLELVDKIEARYPEILTEYRTRLETKVKELLGDTSIDESRLATEIVIYADKIAVDEETVRLRSHVAGAKETLQSALNSGDSNKNGGNADDSIGRRLDFLAQEFNREANTILSKSSDVEIANIGIDLKTEIERVREQIQNIE